MPGSGRPNLAQSVMLQPYTCTKEVKKQCKYDKHTDTQSYCHFWCYLFLWYGIRMSRQGGENIKFLLFQQDFDAMYVSLFLKHKTFYW